MTDFFGSNVDKDKLLEILQKGGHVLYFRHAEPAEKSGDPGLSNEGKKKAESLKLLFQEKKIILNSPIWTSPARRTQETAEIAFEGIERKVNDALYWMDALFVDQPVGDNQKNLKKALANIFESIPEDDTNSVVVGHHFTFGNVISSLPYLGMVVLKPEGEGKGFKVVTNFEF
ncbi:histidine phosphatase family protein [Bacillus sp. 7705b]|uniref:histidine phosphatase family protein n=1 Tax=Bacillus sp. 7705b TaxID=2028568 RepID=UPI000BADF6BC|nr:histidine phosphatase family protein [Bacillus sp. 7705b]PAY13470.1 hypothetical protein CJU60_08770 [Bacillus sp. 7705b]